MSATLIMINRIADLCGLSNPVFWGQIVSFRTCLASGYAGRMMIEMGKRVWPCLVYDQWAAALRAKLQSAGLEVDLLECLRQPPYDALWDGDHRGIVFGLGDRDPEPETTEAVYQDWLGRLRPDCPFGLDLLAERVYVARFSPRIRSLRADYEERMAKSRLHPLKHPAIIDAVLAESRGFVFYRDQPPRILAIVLGVQLHEVDTILKGRAEAEEVIRKKQAFMACLAAMDVREAEACELWEMCVDRYRHTNPRPFHDARRAQIYWALAVRRRYAQLFSDAWTAFEETLS